MDSRWSLLTDNEYDLNKIFDFGPMCENAKDKYAAMRTLRTMRDIIDMMIGKLGNEMIKERNNNE